jgi:hypothetical protein
MRWSCWCPLTKLIESGIQTRWIRAPLRPESVIVSTEPPLTTTRRWQNSIDRDSLMFCRDWRDGSMKVFIWHLHIWELYTLHISRISRQTALSCMEHPDQQLDDFSNPSQVNQMSRGRSPFPFPLVCCGFEIFPCELTLDPNDDVNIAFYLCAGLPCRRSTSGSTHV